MHGHNGEGSRSSSPVSSQRLGEDDVAFGDAFEAAFGGDVEQDTVSPSEEDGATSDLEAKGDEVGVFASLSPEQIKELEQSARSHEAELKYPLDATVVAKVTEKKEDAQALQHFYDALKDTWTYASSQHDVVGDALSVLNACLDDAVCLAILAHDKVVFDRLYADHLMDVSGDDLEVGRQEVFYLKAACLLGAQSIGDALYVAQNATRDDDHLTCQCLIWIAASGHQAWFNAFYKAADNPSHLLSDIEVATRGLTGVASITVDGGSPSL